MWERAWVWGLTGLVAACGGEAEHRASGADAGAASPSAGATSSTGAAASSVGGTASPAGGVASVTGGTPSASGGSAGTDGSGSNELTTNFDTAEPLQGSGLWMGLGEQLPVELPPVEHDGTALHLVGDSGTGFDVFFHTPLPVEKMASEVRFSAYSEDTTALTVGIAGPDATYFSDHAIDLPWPEKKLQVGARWRSYSFSLDKLSPTPPHEEMYGAVHFVVQPGEHYDFWIDDFTLVVRTSPEP